MSVGHYEAIGGALGTALKAIGLVSAAGAVYVAAGLPIPASVAYVDGRVVRVVSSIADLKITVLEGQLRDIGEQRAVLKTERETLNRSLKSAPSSDQAALTIRISEIDDQLSKLTDDGVAIRGRIAEGRATTAGAK